MYFSDDFLFCCDAKLINPKGNLTISLNFPLSEDSFDYLMELAADNAIFEIDEDSEFQFSNFDILDSVCDDFNLEDDEKESLLTYLKNYYDVVTLEELQDITLKILENFDDIRLLNYCVSFADALDYIDSGDYAIYYNDSLRDLAQEILDEWTDSGTFSSFNIKDYRLDLLERLYRYFDIDSLARDLRMDGYYETPRGIIHLC